MTEFVYEDDLPIPEFDHGEDLIIIVWPDSMEFTDDNGGSIRADTVVHVEECV